MKQLLLKGGELLVDEVPPPALEPGHVLVRTLFSCVSVGTELAGVAQNSMPIWRRALTERHRVAQVVDMAKSIGVRNTIDFVQNKLGAGKPLGYSLSGRVLRVGEGVTHVGAGDLVACAGAQCANHAEFVAVPKNLVVAAPRGVSERDVATATVGAIALQGVRRAQPTLGETFVVIGLGLIGLLTVQILKANGCTVIGGDLSESRAELARRLGADFTFSSGQADALAVLERTRGYGADGVIVTAGSKSDEVMSTAFRLTRKKGRVVIVGDIGLSLKRADFYAKEIDVLISCSYGPGRYDHAYEEVGLDYPLPFVRWTEGRNLECFLELIARKLLSIDALGPVTFPLEQATSAYAQLAQKDSAPLAVFLSYNSGDIQNPQVVPSPARVQLTSTGRLRLGIVGAGAFATAVHLPNLKKLRAEVDITAVAGRTGHRVSQVARECGAKLATTDVDVVLSSEDVDAVLIASRHDSHAGLARRALERGKHVFLEKPTATTRVDFADIDKLLVSLDQVGRLPLLMTGYNRRFSRLAVRARAIVGRRACPLVLSYRMAAGYLGPDHWTKTPEGGGRNIGEACHIYDLFSFLVGSPVKTVKATPLGGAQGAYQLTDNFVTAIAYEDGSLATLTYTAQGAPTIEKERLELFSEKTAIVIDNWTNMTIYGSSIERVQLKTQDKGFEEELRAFVASAKGAGEWPIPWQEQRDAAEVAFLAQEQLEGGSSCAV